MVHCIPFGNSVTDDCSFVNAGLILGNLALLFEFPQEDSYLCAVRKVLIALDESLDYNIGLGVFWTAITGKMMSTKICRQSEHWVAALPLLKDLCKLFGWLATTNRR